MQLFFLIVRQDLLHVYATFRPSILKSTNIMQVFLYFYSQIFDYKICNIDTYLYAQ